MTVATDALGIKSISFETASGADVSIPIESTIIVNFSLTAGRFAKTVAPVTRAAPGGVLPTPLVRLYELSALTGPGCATLENWLCRMILKKGSIFLFPLQTSYCLATTTSGAFV